MEDRYRLLRRGRMFYAYDRQTKARLSLETGSRAEALPLLRAKNEAARQPLLNQAIAKVYLAAQDPKLIQRTWQDVMDLFVTKGRDSTRDRSQRAVKSRAYNAIRGRKLVETSQSEFEAILQAGNVSTVHYLRRLHNLAVKRGWILQPILPPSEWPTHKPTPRRAVSVEEHQRILADENDPERKRYYALLWEVGGAQSDVVNLGWENVNSEKNVLIYFRQKTGEKCQLTIGQSLSELLLTMPQSGPFFPRWRLIEPQHRSTEFRRRCTVLKIQGITLHCYRYAWAQRAFASGYPERFAQAALGHKSRAVHRA